MFRVYGNNTAKLENNGTRELDLAFYCWAVTVLNNDADPIKMKEEFQLIADCYDDDKRYFHRGLGHPRSLFPVAIQSAYQKMLEQKLSVEHVQMVISATLPSEARHIRVRAAQEILAAYYHDIVHRNGKKPALLNDYVTDNIKVEELSCIVAEHALKHLSVSERFILPVLLSIIATIPFSEESEPDHLRICLAQAMQTRKIDYDQNEINWIIDAALGLGNRDLGSYGQDSLNEFNKKSWAMMLERNPKLTDPEHRLAEEAETISRFYNLHKKLYADQCSGKRRIYQAIDKENTRVAALNRQAEKTLRQDILLQGLQLGAAVIVMQMGDAYTDLLEQSNDDAKNDDLFDVIAVISEYGKTCTVNGNDIFRGSISAKLALQLVGCLGSEALLRAADTYKEGFQVAQHLPRCRP